MDPTKSQIHNVQTYVQIQKRGEIVCHNYLDINCKISHIHFPKVDLREKQHVVLRYPNIMTEGNISKIYVCIVTFREHCTHCK